MYGFVPFHCDLCTAATHDLGLLIEMLQIIMLLSSYNMSLNEPVLPGFTSSPRYLKHSTQDVN